MFFFVLRISLWRSLFFFFNDTATTEIYTLSLHDALPILTWIFSLGPAPTLMGKPLMYRGPYAVLMVFPGFNALRVPARFWMITTLCLAVIGALDRKSTRLNSSHTVISYAVFCLKKNSIIVAFDVDPAPATTQPVDLPSCDSQSRVSRAYDAGRSRHGVGVEPLDRHCTCDMRGSA